MKDPSYILTADQLQLIKADAYCQLASDHPPFKFPSPLAWNEIEIADFIAWYLDRLARQLPDEIPLSDFDVISVMSMFEDWVKES